MGSSLDGSIEASMEGGRLQGKEEEENSENIPRWQIILKSYSPLLKIGLKLLCYLWITGLFYSYLEDWTIIDGVSCFHKPTPLFMCLSVYV